MAECAKARTGVKAEELAPGDHALVKATYFDDYNQLPNLCYSFQLGKDYVERVIRNSTSTSYTTEFEDGSTASILKSCVRKAYHDLNESNEIAFSTSSAAKHYEMHDKPSTSTVTLLQDVTNKTLLATETIKVYYILILKPLKTMFPNLNQLMKLPMLKSLSNHWLNQVLLHLQQ